MQQRAQNTIYEAEWKEILSFGQVELMKLSDIMRLQQKRYLKFNEDQKKVILFDENKIPKKQFDFRQLSKDKNQKPLSYADIKLFKENNPNVKWSKDQALRQNCKIIKVNFQEKFTLINPTESPKSIGENPVEVYILNLHFEFPKNCLERFMKNQEPIKMYPNATEIMKWDFFSYYKIKTIPQSTPNPINSTPQSQAINSIPQQPTKSINSKIFELQNLLEQALNLKKKEKWIPQIEEQQNEQKIELSKIYESKQQSPFNIQYSRIDGSRNQSAFNNNFMLLSINTSLAVNFEYGQLNQKAQKILEFFEINC